MHASSRAGRLGTAGTGGCRGAWAPARRALTALSRAVQVAARSGDMRAALEACSAALGELVRAAAAPPEAARPDAAPLAAVPEAAEAVPAPVDAPGGDAAAPARRLVSLGDMAAALAAAQGGACPQLG